MKGRYFELGKTSYDHDCIILVEGKDDAMLLDIVLNDLSFGIDSVRVIVCEGKNNFSRHLSLIKKSGSFRSRIKAICVIRDADDDIEVSARELEKAFSNSALPFPGLGNYAEHGNVRFGCYLLPGPGRTGDLEELALDLAGASEALSAASSFIEEMHQRVPLNKISKRKIHAYMAVASRDIRPTVGWGFKDNLIPVSASSVPELAEFLRTAFSE